MTPIRGWKQVRDERKIEADVKRLDAVEREVKKLKDEVLRLTGKVKIVEDKFDQASRHK